MEDSAATLVGFYERAYSLDGSRAAESARWRALSAVGKSEHVIALCKTAGIAPASTLDVGCGDGSLLRELRRAGFGGALGGMEISEAAVEIARRDTPEADIGLFDGEHLPLDDGAYELGVLSHVIEHVPDPPALLAEVARVCRAVVFEVPLEANLSALRRSKREHAVEIGHLQRLSRPSARRIAKDAGLSVAAELQDPLPLEVHRFFAGEGLPRRKATAKWLTRTSLSKLAPPLARRLFTLHYACLCVAPPGRPRP